MYKGIAKTQTQHVELFHRTKNIPRVYFYRARFYVVVNMKTYMDWILAPPRYIYKKMCKKPLKAKKDDHDEPDEPPYASQPSQSSQSPQSPQPSQVYGVQGKDGIKLFESECDALIFLNSSSSGADIIVLDMPLKYSGITDVARTQQILKEHKVEVGKLLKRVDVAEKVHGCDSQRMTLANLDEIRLACKLKNIDLDAKLQVGLDALRLQNI